MRLLRRRHRSEVSVQSQVDRLRAARSVGTELAVDELPICQGLAQLHADVISSLDMYATQNGKRVTTTPDLLEQPDPTEDRQSTVHKLVQSLWWDGNAYASTARAGTISSIHVLNPHLVGYDPDPFDDLAIRGWNVNGMPVPTRGLTHWKLNDDPRKGPLGKSPLVRCNAALANYGWAYRYLADFFANGGNPSLILRSNRPLAPGINGEPGDADIIVSQWIAARQQYRPAVLDGTQWTLEPGPLAQDIDKTVAVLEFAAVEVCRAVNVSPSIGNVLSSGSLTYSTTADELHRWAVLSLGPTWLKRIAAGFTAMLPTNLKCEFDLDTFIDPSSLTDAKVTAGTA
ncbi:MAG: Phage portal protein, partial [Ilumatobacteraceae bacterium]|nr:Phage portal protein [Ilumatobacteraceae bacterium]